MRTILGLASIAFVAFLAWNVGARLSSDAVGMGVGLVFGVLSGIPAALLVLAAGRRRDDGDSYDAGYHAGMMAADDLARGTRPELTGAEWHEAYARQRASSMPGQAPPVIVVDGAARRVYTPAHPFQLPEPAQPPAPVDDDDCPDWCEPWIWEERIGRLSGRQFKVVGELATYDGEFLS